MRGPVLVARLVLGLILLVFGLNGFLGFIPQPPAPEAGGAFLGALAASGYVMTLVKAIEVVVGVLLLAGFFVPLAAVVFMPIAVNIFLYHAVLDPSMPGMAVAAVVFGLTAFLLWAYRGHFAPLREARAVPTGAGAPAPVRVAVGA